MLSNAEVYDPETADMEVTCRICLDEDTRMNVIAPCKCSGGSKWVHRTCLDRWRTVNEDRAFSRCTECLENYVMITREEDCSPDEQSRRKRAYWWHVTRDFSGMFLLTQGVIMLLALITYSCDSTHSTLLHEFSMEKHPKVFYYLSGMVWASALVGLGGMCSLCCNGPCAQAGRNDCPVCYYAGGGGGSADCAGCSCRGCACGDLSGCNCSGASCSGVQCGEAGPFILVIIAGLALIGMVVSVIAGVVFVQRVFQQHMHILHKQGMAKQYIVTDLAADDGGLAALDRQLAREARALGVGAASEARDDSGAGAGAGAGTGGCESSGHKPPFQIHGGAVSPSAPPAYTQLDRGLDEQDIELGAISVTEGTALVSPASRAGSSSASGHGDDRYRHGRYPAPSAPLLTLAQRRELSDLGLL